MTKMIERMKLTRQIMQVFETSEFHFLTAADIAEKIEPKPSSGSVAMGCRRLEALGELESFAGKPKSYAVRKA